MIWLLALGCTGTLSNDPFVEDALFLSALPDPALLELSWPVESLEADPPAELLDLTLSSLNTGAVQTRFVLSLANTVGAVPPSERGEHHRVWGPGAWDDNPGTFLRVEMTRTSDLENYLYTFQTSTTSDGPWIEFFEGAATLSDDPDAPLADGNMTWDADALATVIPDHGAEEMELDYQRAADGTLSLEMSTPLMLSVEQGEDGSGWLFGQTREDVSDGEGRGAKEDLELQSTWLSTGEGRGVLTVQGGDLGASEATLEQCWAATGDSVWSQGDWVDDAGAEADCGL